MDFMDLHGLPRLFGPPDLTSHHLIHELLERDIDLVRRGGCPKIEKNYICAQETENPNHREIESRATPILTSASSSPIPLAPWRHSAACKNQDQTNAGPSLNQDVNSCLTARGCSTSLRYHYFHAIPLHTALRRRGLRGPSSSEIEENRKLNPMHRVRIEQSVTEQDISAPIKRKNRINFLGDRREQCIDTMIQRSILNEIGTSHNEVLTNEGGYKTHAYTPAPARCVVPRQSLRHFLSEWVSPESTTENKNSRAPVSAEASHISHRQGLYQYERHSKTAPLYLIISHIPQHDTWAKPTITSILEQHIDQKLGDMNFAVVPPRDHVRLRAYVVEDTTASKDSDYILFRIENESDAIQSSFRTPYPDRNIIESRSHHAVRDLDQYFNAVASHLTMFWDGMMYVNPTTSLRDDSAISCNVLRAECIRDVQTTHWEWFFHPKNHIQTHVPTQRRLSNIPQAYTLCIRFRKIPGSDCNSFTFADSFKQHVTSYLDTMRSQNCVKHYTIGSVEESELHPGDTSSLELWQLKLDIWLLKEMPVQQTSPSRTIQNTHGCGRILEDFIFNYLDKEENGEQRHFKVEYVCCRSIPIELYCAKHKQQW